MHNLRKEGNWYLTPIQPGWVNLGEITCGRYLYTQTILFYRLSRLCYLASEDIKQNVSKQAGAIDRNVTEQNTRGSFSVDLRSIL